jgi:hypothetical protein
MGSILRFILAAGLLGHGTASFSADPTAKREEAREAIARWWDSIDSIDTKFDLLYSDDAVYVSTQHRLAIASGGRYLVQSYLLARDGRREPVIDHCTDGLKTYRLHPLKSHPGVVDAMSVANSKSTSDSYSDAMDAMIWILMPGGKRLHRWLDEGAEFAVEPDENGVDKYVVRFPFRFKSNPVRCELDPRHDWLPRAIDVGESGKAMRIRVAKFTEQGGRFFPSEGEVTEIAGRGTTITRRLVVHSAAINQPLEAGLFKPQGVLPGTLVMDYQKGGWSVPGGIEARKAFEARYIAPTDSESSGEAPAPLRAEQTPPGWPVAPILGGSALLLLASLVVYRHRNRTDS